MSKFHRPLLAASMGLILTACAGSGPQTSIPDNRTSGKPNTTPKHCTPDYSSQTINVSSIFKEGEWVRDFYSGTRQKVTNGKVTFTPAPNSEGLILIEPSTAPTPDFTWDNATVYFVITDRFANGRTDNDQSYGRKKDGKQEIGTFHGGDLAGLTQKLDYIASLGVNAIWLSPPFEQIHGWVGGGQRGDFPHYGYHGYYTQDFTRLDANIGTDSELKNFVDQAHKKGIRVLLDVVMNHPGYATLMDMHQFNFGNLKANQTHTMPDNWGHWLPGDNQNFHSYHDSINYNDPQWGNWWGKDWIRAGVYNYDRGPSASADPIKGSLAFLPDFKTESSKSVQLPPLLRTKKDTRAKYIPNATVRDYLTAWLSDWVEKYGIDGFRVDTVKHVEGDSWIQLKEQASLALKKHRQKHGTKKGFDEEFWMVGEVFPHRVEKSQYFSQGFDAVINFDFQRKHAKNGANCLKNVDSTFTEYATRLNSDPNFNVMTYISSHDTQLFSTLAKTKQVQKRVAAPLLLLPGAVQIYYGDETMRLAGPAGSDKTQGTRSDMNWAEINSGKVDNVLNHWKKIGQFRNRHPAIGAGQHKVISNSPYAFSRSKDNDRVIIVASESKVN